MIILPGDNGLDKAHPQYPGLTVRLPEASLRSTQSLPDYDTSQKEHLVVKEQRRGRSRFDSTFWRGALLAFVVYAVLSLAIGVPLAVIKLKEQKAKKFKSAPPFSFWSADDSHTPLPLQSLRDSVFGHNIRCNVWDIAEDASSHPFLLATSRYRLPAQGIVTVRSNISYDADVFSGINGSLSVTLNEDKKEKDIMFIVNLLSSRSKLRNETNVCFTDTGPNRGLTIYTPKELEPDDSLSLAVQVQLPTTATIETFLTYLPLFTQHWDIGRGLSFGQLIIEGTNNPISCGNLTASQISVKNVLAPINGAFNVTNSLSLDTVRGPILADVILTQTPSAIQPSFLSLDTGYSPIEAKVTLSSPTSGFTPCFVTQAKTFNGAIQLDISHDQHTPSSSLSVQVQNALAESNVRLDSKFQGMFNVQTKLDQVTVRHSASVINGSSAAGPGRQPGGDPSKRTIIYDQLSPGKAQGWIGRGPRAPPPGPSPPDELLGPRTKESQVEIISTLSPIVLDLG
ncbi:hypothetical protein DFP72DRAFT_880590 [Ephemerocybe angulata]|uniref:Uncharacterized protein n=1 Tax=Ephemerocybe angulata TaxID=980116 RepID=A0A8H6I995_9AGAR|nr:hypothetical protein DFP72DRAFT_880590 [Tulosesus angulatus]